jgi:hypothetical protein
VVVFVLVTVLVTVLVLVDALLKRGLECSRMNGWTFIDSLRPASAGRDV